MGHTIKSIQSLRGIAAILIFYHHFWTPTGLSSAFGDFGVTFFMMLSGFLTMLNYNSHVERQGARCSSALLYDTRNFVYKRTIKLLPVYLLCWLLAVLILPYRGSRAGIIISFFMLQSWIPCKTIYFAGNPVSWFVSSLMFCYLMFVPLFFLWKGNRKAAIFFVISYYVLYFIVCLTIPKNLEHSIIYVNPIMQFSSFLTGLLLAVVYPQLKSCFITYADKSGIVVSEIAVIVIAVLFIIFADKVTDRATLGFYWWPSCVSILYVFCISEERPGLIGRLFQTRLFIVLGNLSMCFYFIHYVGIFLWRLFFSKISNIVDMSLLLQSVVLIIILFGVAYMINKYYAIPACKVLGKLKLTPQNNC